MPVRIKAVGDIFGVGRKGGDPFIHVADLLRDCDLCIGNLESCVTGITEAVARKAVTLCSPPIAADYCVKAGFHALTIANNHILDYGIAGAIETVANIRRVGIAGVGAGCSVSESERLHTFNVNSSTIGVMAAYEHGGNSSGHGMFHIAGSSRGRFLERIRGNAKACDILIVSLHWGVENTHYPSHVQQQLARDCIDAGARLLFGHHPHRVQGVERHGNGLVFYSLGNFNFMPCGTELSDFATFSVIADVTVEGDGPPAFELIPITVNSEYAPVPEKERDRCERYRAHMAAISEPLQGHIRRTWWYGEIGSIYLRGNLEAFGVRIRRHGLRHAWHAVRWLLSPFNLRVYAGLLLRFLSRAKKSHA